MTNPVWKSIADAAPTLEDLKKLSFERQILLLLARLNVLYPQMAGTGGLHWGNLKLDGYDLAIGYEPNEKKGMIEYLLGRPWMELIQRGYLVQVSPEFYRISEDGIVALNDTKMPLISRAALEAVKLLHSDLGEAERDFREGRFDDAVRDAFRIYENRLNAMRDVSSDPSVHGRSGAKLAHALVKSAGFRFPFPGLAPTDPSALEGYKEALRNTFAGALGLVRNAYDHEAHNLPALDERSALELLFFASYLLRLLDLSK
jgi:Protein of unknown function (Hypoth_ymh)